MGSTDADMRAAFIRAIREEPSEDFHRLVFADYLEERGDERDAAQAEFIRVQCKLARQPSRCDCTCEYECGIGCASVIHGQLRLREDELIRFNVSHWIWHCLPEDWKEGFGTWHRPKEKTATQNRSGRRQFCGFGTWHRPKEKTVRIISKQSVCRELEFRRGFIAEVHCTFQAWLNDGGMIVRSQPIEVVRPTDKMPYRLFGDARWYWLEENPNSPYSIGECWHSLGKTEWENGYPRRNRGYDSEQEAYDDLSETLIKLAQKK